MANYEMMLIVDSNISEEDRNTSIAELKELFKANSVVITKEDIW
jgi:ribosomal protein S6